jgi:hypothetical protein
MVPIAARPGGADNMVRGDGVTGDATSRHVTIRLGDLSLESCTRHVIRSPLPYTHRENAWLVSPMSKMHRQPTTDDQALTTSQPARYTHGLPAGGGRRPPRGSGSAGGAPHVASVRGARPATDGGVPLRRRSLLPHQGGWGRMFHALGDVGTWHAMHVS